MEDLLYNVKKVAISGESGDVSSECLEGKAS